MVAELAVVTGVIAVAGKFLAANGSAIKLQKLFSSEKRMTGRLLNGLAYESKE